MELIWRILGVILCDSTRRRIEDDLKTIVLSGREIEQKRVAKVKIRMDMGSSNSNSIALYKRWVNQNYHEYCDSEIAE